MYPLLFNLGMTEIIGILLIVVLLFGGKKIPELMKGVGKGMRAFKEGMNEAEGEIKKAMEEPAAKKSEPAENKTENGAK